MQLRPLMPMNLYANCPMDIQVTWERQGVRLSGGQRQRIAIAPRAAQKPQEFYY